MWGIVFVRKVDVVNSTSVRLAFALTAVFLTAYLTAGFFALQRVNEELSARVVHGAELIVVGFEEHYRAGGEEALIAAVSMRASSIDSEDEVVWLGTLDGSRVAGSPISGTVNMKSGDIEGVSFASEADDRYRVLVRPIGNFRLIVALSYEEADDIQEVVLAAFAWATAATIIFAVFFAALLARRGQRRIDAIISTLKAVSIGDMKARAPISGSGDDLDRLSGGINEALKQLEETVGGIQQVSTDIAHDLRTPVNRLGILLERARTSTPISGDSNLLEQLDEAVAAVGDITKTFDALMRIAQIEAGARKKSFEKVSLTDRLNILAETYLPVAEENGHTLCLVGGKDAEAWVYGDREFLTQLFANLIENAIRHCPSGSSIRLTVGVENGCAYALVADDGPGIPPDEHDKVLRRFYRLDKARHTLGTGLGLALVKAVALLHDATLTIDDNDPGLTVRLDFPRYNGQVGDK
ncbi:putative sensor-like histidine kinase YedV [Rhodobiaceae bacterium]|nr:putative sensor-like histidine kinase YedV [Rhodobiaceae bacterium]